MVKTLRLSALLVGLAAIGLGAGALAHGGHDHAGPGSKAAPPAPEETAAFEKAKPILEKHCFRCHTTGGKKAKPKTLSHLNMDGYPFSGHHASGAGTAIRTVLLGKSGKGGEDATMPKDDRGAVDGDDLKTVLAWADAFDKAHPTKSSTKPKSGAAPRSKEEGQHGTHESP